MAAVADIAKGEVSAEGFETRGTLPYYWAYQDQGTSKTGWGPGIPQRKFWEFGDDLLDLIASLLAEAGQKAITGN